MLRQSGRGPKTEGFEATRGFWQTAAAAPVQTRPEVERVVICGAEALVVFTIFLEMAGRVVGSLRAHERFVFGGADKISELPPLWDAAKPSVVAIALFVLWPAHFTQRAPRDSPAHQRRRESRAIGQPQQRPISFSRTDPSESGGFRPMEVCPHFIFTDRPHRPASCVPATWPLGPG